MASGIHRRAWKGPPASLPPPRSAAALLGHELRVPLGAILNGLVALETVPDLPAEALSWTSLIRRNLAMADRIVDDVVEAARAGRAELSLRPEAVDVHELLREVLAMFAGELRAGDISLLFLAEADRCGVRADRVRLAQVFWNLVQNAVKFTPAGGEVVVRTRRVSRELIIEVEDSGAGISRGCLEEIFRPFVKKARDDSTEGEGLGLGLSLCKQIVEKHGGRIWADSEGAGKGARFTVALALPGRRVERAARVSAGPAVQGGANGVRPRVLLVDDHADTVDALALLLRARGYEVEEASTVAEALAVEPSIGLVVSDIALPDGSGLALMRQLRARGPVRGVAVSGFGGPSEERAARRAGFDLVLRKPVPPAVLLGAVDRLCAQAVGPRQGRARRASAAPAK